MLFPKDHLFLEFEIVTSFFFGLDSGGVDDFFFSGLDSGGADEGP